MVGDPDLLSFRGSYYDLLVSLLWREPAADLLAGLGQGIGERVGAARDLHPLLGAGWEAIAGFLGEVAPGAVADTVADEYARLFLGPWNPEIHPYESYYLTGRLLDRPLAAVRASMREFGLERQREYAEPEDHLALELDVVRRLVARQASARDADEEGRWLTAQATFLKRHLAVWGPQAARDLAAAKSARFYRGIGLVVEGFLEMERDLLREWGPDEVLPLEEARRRAGGAGEWRGPRFDPGEDDRSGRTPGRPPGPA